MALDEVTVITIIAIVVTISVAASATVIFAMRRRMRQPQKPASTRPPQDPYLTPAASPFHLTKSIQYTEATNAKDELRILDLEREILADAIRHLYEAHAAGKITETERERLAGSYKNRMMSVKESIAKDETIVALHELESMQEDLMKMFSSRFGELTGKVEELRSRIDIKPVKEIKIQTPRTQPQIIPVQMEAEEDEEEEETLAQTKEPKKKRKPPSERKSQKTEAEQRIDAIRNQIDEVMNKLGQMEMEA